MASTGAGGVGSTGAGGAAAAGTSGSANGNTGGAGGGAGAGGSAGGTGAGGNGADAGGSDGSQDASGVCPSGIVMSGQVEMPLRGLVFGIDLQTDICPQGEVLRGYVGSTGNRQLDVLQALCGRVEFFQAALTCQIAIRAGTMMPRRGNATSTSPWLMQCPTNEVMVVAHGRAGGRIDALGMECAPLVLSGSSSTGFQLSIGSLTSLGPEGGPAGTPFRDACPAGQVASGSKSNYNGSISTYQLLCATPTLVP